MLFWLGLLLPLFETNHLKSHKKTQVALAKRLVESSFADKAFFCNSGTEANEAAIKFARKWARVRAGVDPYDPNASAPHEIVSFTSCFHGAFALCCCVLCAVLSALTLNTNHPNPSRNKKKTKNTQKKNTKQPPKKAARWARWR